MVDEGGSIIDDMTQSYYQNIGWIDPRFDPNTVYLRGSMNGWGLANPMMMSMEGTYKVQLHLMTGEYQLKFATADWVTVDLGAPEYDLEMQFGEVQELQWVGPNIQLFIDQEGIYEFTLNHDGMSPSSAEVMMVQP